MMISAKGMRSSEIRCKRASLSTDPPFEYLSILAGNNDVELADALYRDMVYSDARIRVSFRFIVAAIFCETTIAARGGGPVRPCVSPDDFPPTCRSSAFCTDFLDPNLGMITSASAAFNTQKPNLN